MLEQVIIVNSLAKVKNTNTFTVTAGSKNNAEDHMDEYDFEDL
jgi:hypothetical protein